MPNLLSEDVVVAGGFKTLSGNNIEQVLAGSVARTDTSAKTLGAIPASATITSISFYSAVGSDAGTTATLSIGKSGGTGTEYVNAMSVKGNAGLGVFGPTTFGVLGTVGTSNVTVTGIYAETGSASTTGGPWQVYIRYIIG